MNRYTITGLLALALVILPTISPAVFAQTKKTIPPGAVPRIELELSGVVVAFFGGAYLDTVEIRPENLLDEIKKGSKVRLTGGTILSEAYEELIRAEPAADEPGKLGIRVHIPGEEPVFFEFMTSYSLTREEDDVEAQETVTIQIGYSDAYLR